MPMTDFIITTSESGMQTTCALDEHVPLTANFSTLSEKLLTSLSAPTTASFYLCDAEGRPVSRLCLDVSLNAQGVREGSILFIKMPSDPSPTDQHDAPLPLLDLSPVLTQPSSTSISSNGRRLRFDLESNGGAPRPALRTPSSSTDGHQPRAPRRSIDSGEIARVHVTTDPAEVIEATADDHAHQSPMVPLDQTMRSAVANILADIGSENNPELHEWFLQLAAMILSRRPADPEQCLVDYFYSNKLGSSQAGSNCRDDDLDGIDDAGGATTEESPESEAAMLSFSPVGDTLVERLAFGAPSGPGRTILEKVARLILDKKPDEPEDFLWTSLEGSRFGDEVAAASAIVYNDDGFPLLPPDDPTLVSLLREIPVTSPGYSVVAANVIPLLFAKKPEDPLNHLFDHFSGRHKARSSLAASVRSTSKVMADEEDMGSCTSRDDDANGNNNDNDGMEMNSPSRNTVNAFLAAIQRKGSMSSNGSRRRRPSSNTNNNNNNNSNCKDLNRYRCFTKEATTQTSTIDNYPPSRLTTAPPASSYFPPAAAAASHHHHHHNHFSQTQHYNPQTVSASEVSASGGSDRARVRSEFDLMRAKNQMRRERLTLEMEGLRREVHYRERVAALTAADGTDYAAQTAVAAAREALREAEQYLSFLEGYDDRLLRHMERQMRSAKDHSGSGGGPAALSSYLHAQHSCHVQQQQQPSSAHVGAASSSSAALPTELEILQRRVEVLSMEQARLKASMHSAAAAADVSGYAIGNAYSLHL